ncbi:MAG: hypothetical protein H8D78_19145 [Chloroflexi bacterium]|nr:hypothetical protein [Chloroflexota bacterium]
MSVTVSPTTLLESLAEKEVVLLPLDRYQELVSRAEEPARQQPFAEVLAFRQMLSRIPAAEAILAKRLPTGYRIWTVTDTPDEEIMNAIYWREWELMERFPETDFDFHLLRLCGQPLTTLVTLADFDIHLPLHREHHYA